MWDGLGLPVGRVRLLALQNLADINEVEGQKKVVILLGYPTNAVASCRVSAIHIYEHAKKVHAQPREEKEQAQTPVFLHRKLHTLQNWRVGLRLTQAQWLQRSLQLLGCGHC